MVLSKLFAPVIGLPAVFGSGKYAVKAAETGLICEGCMMLFGTGCSRILSVLRAGP